MKILTLLPLSYSFLSTLVSVQSLCLCHIMQSIFLSMAPLKILVQAISPKEHSWYFASLMEFGQYKDFRILKIRCCLLIVIRASRFPWLRHFHVFYLMSCLYLICEKTDKYKKLNIKNRNKCQLSLAIDSSKIARTMSPNVALPEIQR